MSDRDYGQGLQQYYLDPTGRNYETVVYNELDYVSSSDLNLLQDVNSTRDQDSFRRTTPSGFLNTSLLKDSYEQFSFRSTANTFHLVNKPVVNVNGWVFPVEYTDTTTDGENDISLPAAPSLAGSTAGDFVFLEAWRSLINPDPDATNKPSSDKIYRHGNVLSPSGVWLDDEMKNNPISSSTGTETTSRLQVQYRIRTVRLDDFNTARNGFDDVNVEAQGPNGTPVSGESFSQDTDDKGLWVAGDELGSGNEIAGTADGFVFAIPIALVFRRNSAGFDFLSNGNGGQDNIGGTSDRPDGLFSDQIILDDVQDLRHAVSMSGSFDGEALMDKSVSLLMDQEQRAWASSLSYTEWYVGGNNESNGNRYLKADDIIPSSGSDKSSGNNIRSADGICSVISDRAQNQRHLIEYDVSNAAGANWAADDSVTLDFTSGNLDDEQPPGTVISDVLVVRLNDASGGNNMPEVPIKSVTGLGTKTVTVTIDTPPITSSNDLWVLYEVSYPRGSGLTSYVSDIPSSWAVIVHNPSAFNGPEFSTTWTDDDNATTGRPAFRDFLVYGFEDGPHREVKVQYRTEVKQSINVFAYDDGGTIKTRLPHHPYVQDPPVFSGPPQTSDDIYVEDTGSTSYEVDSVDGREVIFAAGSPPSAGTELVVEYHELKPLPDNGVEATIFYRSPAIQAIPEELLDDPMTVEPIYVSEHLYNVTYSSGAYKEAYPYPTASDQVPVNINAQYDGEEELNAPGPISIGDFDADVGMLRLETLVPMANIDELVLSGAVNVIGSQNQEFNDHYTSIANGNFNPAAFAQSLSTPVEHKSFLPVLVRIPSNTEWANEGELCLMILTSHLDFSASENDPEENKVVFDNDNSCVALYKIKNNPLVK